MGSEPGVQPASHLRQWKELELQEQHRRAIEERTTEKRKLELDIQTLTTQLGLKQQDLDQQRANLSQMQDNMLQGVEFSVAEEMRRLQSQLTALEDQARGTGACLCTHGPAAEHVQGAECHFRQSQRAGAG